MFSVLLLCFLLVSCGEEKTIQERAESGDAEAQNSLGWMYYKGGEVPKDHAEAAKWFRKAAQQGDADSQSSLGSMYSRGEGVPKDDVVAYMFFNLAAANGGAGEVNMDKLKRRMTKEQIAEGQKLTRERVARKAREKGK